MSTNFLSDAGYSNDKYRASWFIWISSERFGFLSGRQLKKVFPLNLAFYFGFEQLPSPMTSSFPYGVVLTPKARAFWLLNAWDVQVSVSTLAGLEPQLSNFWCFNLSQSLSRWSLVRFPKTVMNNGSFGSSFCSLVLWPANSNCFCSLWLWSHPL